jgi:predicted O-linked N-acetylglucosamine transferase (SPINDLY family)
MITVPELLAAASQNYQSGRRDLAIECLDQALRLRPNIPEAHNNLGIVLAQEGRLAEALASFQQAVRLEPGYAEAHNNLGNALREQGSLGEAAGHLQTAVRLRRDYAEAHYNLGIVLLAQGNLAEAAFSLQQAVRVKPDYAEAHFNLGVIFDKQGKPAEVEASLRQAVRLKPDHAEAHLNLGVALAQQEKLEEAAASFRQAVRLSPDSALAHCNLGNALREQGQPEEAIASLREALRLQPESPEAHNNLGLAFQVQGKLDEAAASYQRALGCKPGFAEAYQNLGNVLKDLSRLDEAIAAFRTALGLKPNPRLHSSLLWILKLHPNVDARAIYEESRRWNQQHAEPLETSVRPHANDPNPQRRLRIGYVSPDFCEHSCSFFTIPLLSNHDHQQCEIYCYADVKSPDSFTDRLRHCADVWRSIAGLSDDQVAELIRSDQIDILVDLAMHTSNNRLLVFARKPAPVQVAWLAYPGTTGLSAIDYRLTDPYFDPPGLFDDCCSEESVRLPETFWCYDPLTDQPPVNPLPALESGVITFGCLNNFDKVNEAVLSLWAQVLRAVPRSRLLLLAPQGQARLRVLAQLDKEGIATERVEFADRMPKPHYLKMYQRMDLCLDPFPCNGGTTTLDAFWMGVPTITLVGQTLVGRAGWSLVCNLGLKELAAETPEQYVALAVQLAGDPPRLDELRRTMRQRMRQSPLMDANRFARNMEQAYRQMWRRWCEQPRRVEISQPVTHEPDRAEPHFNLGNVLFEQGKLPEAEASFRQAVRERPDHAEAYTNLGAALLKQGRLEEAASSLQQAVRVKDDVAAAHHNLAMVLHAQGNLTEAVASLQQAVRLKPDYAEAYLNLGTVMQAQGNLEEAEANYRQAVRFQPDYPEAYNNLGTVLQKQGFLEEAAESLRQAVRLKSDYADAHQNLGNVLNRQGRLEDGLAAYRTALQLKPDNAGLHSSLIFLSHYHPGYDDRAIYEECRRWHQQHAEPFKRSIRPHSNATDPERRLRIGYISPDLRDHVISYFMIPLLENHDHQQCEIYCYADVKCPDSFTDRLRRCADVWRSIAGLSDDRVAELIRGDQIDILVDLAMHSANNRLLVFARKPAPVQVAWLAYPGTTGLSAIDYRLTDPYFDPPGLFDDCCSEESVRLPETFWCYDPLTDQPPVNPLPALESGVITFGCLNNFSKVNEAVLSLWAQVLRAVPRSRLLLLAPQGQARLRVLAQLDKEGIATERVEFADRMLTKTDYLKMYQRMDLGLDPFPCNGGTTTLDAFWMGVPTITLVGQTLFGRAGWSLVCNLGLKELAAETSEQYVALAARLAGDLPRLDELRRTMRQRMRQSPLMDGNRFARNMEQAYRQMWRRWCQRSGPGEFGKAIAGDGPAVKATKTDEAEGHFQQGLTLAQQGRYEDAVVHYQQALRLKPDSAGGYNNLGNVFILQGNLPDAVASYSQAVRARPDFALGHCNLGNALREQGRLEEAVASLREALRLQPNYAEAYNNLGIALQDQGKLDEALSIYQQALRCKPDYPEAHLNLGNVFKELGRLDDALAAYRNGLAIRPDAAYLHSNLILSLHYHPGYDARAIDEECRRWNQRHAEPLQKFVQPHGNRRVPERRLRIGYVSPHFCHHAITFATVPLLSSHDHQHFEIVCYANVPAPDEMTERLRGYADVWRNTVGLSDQQVADLVRSDQIDILIDLAMHTANSRLRMFARKPAPIQVAWAAYPGTTGLSTMDYRLTDPYLDPPGMFDAFYAEQCLRLPDSFWCYDPLTNRPPVNDLPALENRVITFGALNSFCKINDECLALWAQVLKAVPQSRLLLLAPAGEARQRVLARLQSEGIAAERVEFADRQRRLDYLEQYQRIDVGLDPLPYNGHTTSLDALWMGVPTITLVSKTTAFGRAGWSQLCNLGLKELAAETPEEYVALAARLAGDLPRLQHLRSTLRQRMQQSPLMDGRRFARNVEEAYRQIWRTWCEQAKPAGVSSAASKDQPSGTMPVIPLPELLAAAAEHYQSGRHDLAIDCLGQALRLRPAIPEAHNNLGIVLAEQGRLAEAAASFQKAVRLKPDDALAHNNLGNVLRELGSLEEAVGHLQQALRLRPNFAEAHNNLGIVLAQQGKLAEAVASYQEAVHFQPGWADAHSNLGNALQEQGHLAEAEASLQQALRLKPDLANAYYNLGIVLAKQRRLEEATAHLQQALRIQPDHVDAHMCLGDVCKDQGRLDEALAAYRTALRLKPAAVNIHSNLILTLHYHPGYDARAIYEECRRWSQQHAEPLRKFVQPHGNRPDPERRLRIGYVSPHFCHHAITFATVPLLSTHDHRQFEIVCYASVPAPDQMTERLRGYADVWRNTVGLSDQQVADLVRSDQIDILVDLAMHTTNSRLRMFARKPAPIQVAWAAYPGSTGLSTIDYRLTDPYLDPPGMFDAFYVERCLRLPDSFWCYDPLTEQPPVNDLPALENRVITFGCLNSFCKINDGCLALWAQVLKAVPESRLLLLAPAGEARQRVLARLQSEGIAAERVEFADRQRRPVYLEQYQRIDIGLDPLPYNGHTTSLDALWMGVPTITLVSNTTAFGRAGWSQLCNLGLKELAAETPEEYIAVAVRLAGDLPRLQHLRSTLRQRMQQSPLMDGQRFARNVEAAYRQIWRTWCEQAKPAGVSNAASKDQPSGPMPMVPVPELLAAAAQHYQSGRRDLAIDCLGQALRLRPGIPEAHNNLGIVLAEQGRLEEAAASFRQAVRLKPDDAVAHSNLGNALREQGQLKEAVASLQQALRLRPDYAEAHSSLILTMHYLPGCNAGLIQQECRRWNQQHAEPLKRLIQAHSNQPDPERRLRIGYVSPMFRDHVHAFFTVPLLSNHDHRHCEIYCYSDAARPDATTERHRGYADVWRSTVGLSDQQVADLVRSDQIDILVDLAMHTASNRLLVFARKPAPVQVCWLAYPGTTGLSVMDYRLTDPYLDPPGLFDAFYAEESVRLPDTFWCYDPLTGQPAVNDLPAQSQGLITFGCLNNFCKVNDDCLALWAQVLQAVPRSRILLLAPQEARERVLAKLEETGIAASRIEFTPALPRLEYLGLYHRIDLGLDPLPYNGHTTSLDAFWMGVPTITLVSKTTAFGRAGWSQLCNLGLKELAAETPEEYVAAAARLAGDLPRLRQLRSTLRQRMQQSPLMDSQRFARNVEAAYRLMWRRWCQQPKPAGTTSPRSMDQRAEPMPASSVMEFLAAAAQHYQSGRHDLAIHCLSQALRLRPGIPEAHNNLGIVLAEQGRLAEAAASFRKAVRLKPDDALAHNNLGNALRGLGSLEEAAGHLHEALRLRPDSAEAHNNLGIVFVQEGSLAEATARFQEAVRLQPNYADAHHNLGDALTRQGYLREAARHLHEALRLRPDLAKGYFSLGLVLHEEQRLADAEASLRQALRLKPDYVAAHDSLGQVLREQNRLEEARASFQQALRLDANSADAHYSLGALLEDMGDLDAAAGCYRDALRHEPGHVGALAGLATMLRGKLPEPELGRIREQLARPQLTEAMRCRLLYALAQVLDARGEYDTAAAHLEAANALELAGWQKRGRAYDPADFSRLVDRLQQNFDRSFFDKVRGWGLASERPVFIFGLPRSGTTLTEQILASHSHVHGGGELSFAQNDFEALTHLAAGPVTTGVTAAATASGRAKQLEAIFAALERLDRAAVQRLAQQHLDRLEALNPSRARITSKTPDDWQLVGLLAVLFPQARFIHCRRNLGDVAVSCWMTQFRLLNWTCDLDHIASRFNDYQRLMAHWRACLPVPMLEIDYEETVADLDGTARRLVSWLGLDWEAACLNFHQTRRTIRTASVAQVRQPLFHTSVGRWQNYASTLSPLMAQLGD